MSGRPAHRWKILPAAVSLILWAPVPLHAAELGRLVEKDGQYVFVESLDPATKLLLERAVRQGTITQAEYDNVVLESERRAYLMQPSYKLWYDRGFNISLNDNAFLLKIRARFMGRMTSREELS
jgi:hypothetical protein